jgi:hypothetical protein
VAVLSLIRDRTDKGEGMTTKTRRRLPWIAVVAALVGASQPGGATATVGANGVITGSGTSYRLTVTNTGTEPIKCFGLLLDGVQPTSASGPPGVLTRVGTFQGKGLVHMQGDLVVPPGGTVNVDFQTNVAIPANAGGEIRYSATCLAGSDVVGRATGPTPPPPPPPRPEPKRCACKQLKARIVPNRLDITRDEAAGATLEVLVSWTMTCTRGAGTCEGTITLAPSARGKRLGARVTAPAAGGITCTGPCTKTTTRFQKFVVTTGPRYGLGKRGKTDVLLRLQAKRVCGATRIPQTFDIVFARTGAIDLRRSDLNANGRPDSRS